MRSEAVGNYCQGGQVRDYFLARAEDIASFYYLRYQRLQYLWYRTTKPRVRDFLDVGFGIDLRSCRFREAWAHHLVRTRSFINEATKEGGDEVVVLGVGRLRDCPLAELVERFSQVILIDVDPRVIAWCRGAVRRFGGRVFCEETDVTGVFGEWSEALKAIKGEGEEQVSGYLGKVVAPKRWWSDDTVISLNLLSQIGVMWRDRVEGILGPDTAQMGNVAEATSSAIARLERAHSLGLAAAERSVLVADRFFYSAHQRRGPWEVEDALYGLWPEQLPGRRDWLRGSWLWQLVPPDGEREGEEIVHEVWARAFQ